MYPPSYDRDGWPRRGPRSAWLRRPNVSWNGVTAVPAETAEGSPRGLADDGYDHGEWHLFQPTDEVALRTLARLTLATTEADRAAVRAAFGEAP